MEKYICIHGHFYQPPRENPWLEAIELQDSAYPYHDWNERITAESYEPNAASRILKDHRWISQIVNNYSRISFNFGPTLLAWMEPYAPDVYQAILDADRKSVLTFSGHGSALAQAYNHMILPLANSRDKRTQVIWGIRDFQRRFGRDPEGMWLPETAVDLESLDFLAQMGIKFTILSPYQARRVRPLQPSAGIRWEWKDVTGGRIDPTMPYLARLPSGRSIALFFYDGPISRSVAFEGILGSGERFAERLMGAFSPERKHPQIVHIATDGETYGHHHRHGDMALAYALHYIESKRLARVTNYSEYLAKHPPTYEVQIYENTSWSCAHGIERWRSNCGCSSGGHPGWDQGWRAPLRKALDWLRDALAPRYEELGGKLFADPWKARNEYIEVVLDRSPENVQRFLDRQASRRLDQRDTITALKLLEMQRHAMLMYTSCGWFFDELSGIETVQVIQYAARAIQLAEELFGDSIEAGFLKLLAEARSNIREHRDGRAIYEKWVKPSMVDLARATAHYAVSSLFEDYGSEVAINSYSFHREDYQVYESGRMRLAIGRVSTTSSVTFESDAFSFGLIHFGDHTVNAGVRRYMGQEAYQQMLQEVKRAFDIADLPEVIRLLDRHFGNSTYSLRSLFRDEQRKVLDHVLAATLTEAEAEFRRVYDRNYPLMCFITDLGEPLPRAFRAAAEFVLNTDLRRTVSDGILTSDPATIISYLEDARLWNVRLDSEGLSFHLQQTLEGMMARFSVEPEELSHLNDLHSALSVVESMPLEVNLRKVQNIYYQMMQTTYPRYQLAALQRDGAAREWAKLFASLGERLSIQVASL